jgi:hypothetical protein
MVINSYAYSAAGFSGLLDDYPGAARAYSLRALDADFETSDLITVRRSSDDATASYTEAEINDGTLLTWVGTGGTDNGFVTTWYDQSGNALNCTMTTAANQPAIVSAGVLEVEGGEPAVYFDGTSDYLNFSTVTAKTVIGVTNMETAAGSLNHFIGNEGDDRGLRATDSTTLYKCPENSTSEATWDLPHDGACFVNGSGTTPTAAGHHVVFATSAAGMAVRSISSSHSTNSRHWKGPVQEVIIYDTDKTSDRSGIESNINTHYTLF